MRFFVTAFLVLSISLISSQGASAATQLQNRQVNIRSSQVSASPVIYNFRFDISDTSALGSIRFEICSNSPLFTEPCTVPSGFNALGVAIDSEAGETGFVLHPSSDINNIILTRVPTAPTPGTVSYGFDGITNPDYLGTFYVRIATYSSIDASGPALEEGGMATSTARQVDLEVEVPPFLIFCVAKSILFQDCSTASGNQVSLGTFSETSTGVNTAQLFAATNAEFGYAIVAYGTTLTSGTNKIDGINPRSSSNPGSAQFGFNLVANTSPSIGINPTGPGSATPTPDYSVANEFKFLDGDPLVINAGPDDRRTYTASYITNIPEDQAPGVYTTTLTFVCTALF